MRFAIALLLVACGGTATTSTGNGTDGGAADQGGDGASTVPDGSCAATLQVTDLTPPALVVGTQDEALAILGSGFTPSTTATLMGAPLAVTHETPTELDVTVPAALLGAVGQFALVVSDPSCGGRTVTRTLAVRSPASLAAAGWPRHHHDNQNTSATSSRLATSPSLVWKRFTAMPSPGVTAEGGGFWSAPVVGAGAGELAVEHVFVGAPDGTVFSFGSDGTPAYHFTGVGANPYGIDGVAAVRSDGTLYVGVSDARLYALTPDGKQAWSYTTGQTSDASSAIAEDGTILYASDDGKVYALTPDGQLKWSSAAPGEVDSAIATSVQTFGEFGQAVTVYVGGASGWFALDGGDGHTVWSVPATGPRGATVSSPVLFQGGVLVGIDSGGAAVVLDAATGKPLSTWKAPVPAGIGITPAAVGDTVYYVAGDGKLYAAHFKDGTVQWSADVHGAVPSGGEGPTPSVDGNGDVFVYSPDGNLYRFGADGTPRPTIKVSAPLGEFIVPQVAIGAEGTLYISASDGNLCAYK